MMKKNNVVILITIVFFTVGSFCSYGSSPSVGDSIRFEILLNSKMIKDAHLDVKFIQSIEIASNKLVMLSSTNQFYILGWGGILAAGPKNTGAISSFTYSPDGYLMIVRNNELCYVDSAGNLAKLYSLPDQKMGIASGDSVMYAYDRNNNSQKSALYVISKGGKYKELFVVPFPIRSVAEMNNSILFATENNMFGFNQLNNELKALISLPKDKIIESITVSPGNMIYFSTNDAIYALKDTSLVIISNKIGGVLKYYIDGLLVFNPEKKYLIRIKGLENALASKALALNIGGKENQTKDESLKSESVAQVNKNPVKSGLTVNETSVKPAAVPVQGTVKPTEPETTGSPGKEIHVPANCVRAEKFISNTSGNLVKGKTYILKKDFSQPIDFLNNFPDGSILKLVGSDPGVVKSWKVVKPDDGSYALIDSKLYIFFEQAHVWLLKPTQ